MNAPPRSSVALVSIVALLVAAAALALGVIVVMRHGDAALTDTLVLRDQAGHDRVRLLARDSGGSIELVDATGRTRASLKQDGETVVVELFPGGTAAHAVAFQYTPRGGGLLELDDQASKSIVKVSARDGGGVTITTPHGGASMISSPSISSSMALYFGDQQGTFEVSQARAELSVNGKGLTPTAP